MSARYHFCYGEELDPEWRSTLCRESGRQDPLARPSRAGFLADRQLVFRKPRRLGAEADLTTIRRPGQLVQGFLFEVAEADLDTLDQWAGTSLDLSRRREVEVLGEDGQVVQASLLEKTPPAEGRFQPPTSEQLQRLMRGLEALDLDEWMAVDASRDRAPRWWVDAFFVYGSLLRGERERSLLGEPDSIRCTLLARVPGRLHVLGSQASLLPGSSPGQWVQGEYVRLQEPGEVVERLDSRATGEPVRRVLLQADAGERHIRTTWAYRRVGDLGRGVVLPEGDWRAYMGHRERVLESIARGHLREMDAKRAASLVGDDAEPDPVVAVTRLLMNAQLKEHQLARLSGRWSLEI